MTTRFLLTCISSYYFHKEETLDGLHQCIAEDAVRLYHDGLEVLGANKYLFSYVFHI